MNSKSLHLPTKALKETQRPYEYICQQLKDGFCQTNANSHRIASAA
jgi:hypothetical protein